GLTTAAGLWTSAIIGLTFGGGFYEGGILATVFIMLAELVFSRIEYRVLENVPEINLYMEYEGKHCLDDVLQLYRSCNIKVLNIQITRSAENGEHNACAIFTLRLPRSCGVEKLLTLVGKRKGIVSVEEL
ncbi:MgtC/SapB family protein, partial [Agathobaculum sp.]